MKFSDDHIFTLGVARFSDLIYLAIMDKGMQEDDIQHTRLVGFDEDDPVEVEDVMWTAVALCVVRTPEEKLVAISDSGNVLTYVAGDSTIEQIEPNPHALRGLGVVEGQAFACGMRRQVFRRSGENRWDAMHAPDAGSEDEIVGFEGLAGFALAEIYAVGWMGEIWEWSSDRWVQHDSPTSSILTAVCCTDDGHVYVCGQSGVLLRGRHDKWEIIADGIADDFWDVCWFDSSLYVASMSALYRLENDELIPVDFGEDAPTTFNKLTHAEGVMWSIGSSNVFSFDSDSWARVE